MVHFENTYVSPDVDSAPVKRKKLSNRMTSRNISLSTINNRHPLNVKPGGNSLLYSNPEISDYRFKQMGHLAILPEEVLMMLLGYIRDIESLKNLSHTSKVMYAYLFDEELWKNLYIGMINSSGSSLPKTDVKWRGSWRSTLLGIDYHSQALLQFKDGYLCSDVLYRPCQCAQVDYSVVFNKIIREEELHHENSLSGESVECLPGRIQRFREEEVTTEDFIAKLHDIPFILTNKKEDRWPKWTLDDLLARFADVSFRQEAVQWKLSSYSDYFVNNKDESPLYLFDCKSHAMQTLRKEYQVPEIFKQDFFTVFEKAGCRPDYAWLIVGPSRSGSTFHKDPNYTSAWNTALTGRKLWIMLPSHITPPGVGTDSEEKEVTSPVGIAEWVISGFFNDCLKIDECLIGITFPGECMHVPSGWWHSVINIDNSVALTQNFCPLPKLANTLNFLKTKRDQISGFYPHNIKHALDQLSSILKDENEETKELVKYRDHMSSQFDDKLETEDCGEILESLLPSMPIYELFKVLLIEDGKKEFLAQALEKLQNRSENNSSNNNKQHKSWKSLTTKESTASSFSFNFDEDSDVD